MSLHGTKCDLGAAPTNVRSWESNGLNADVAFGPFMTPKQTLPRSKSRSAAAAAGRVANKSSVEKSIEQYYREHNERPTGCKIASLSPD
jgi:hypothetical protein